MGNKFEHQPTAKHSCPVCGSNDITTDVIIETHRQTKTDTMTHNISMPVVRLSCNKCGVYFKPTIGNTEYVNHSAINYNIMETKKIALEAIDLHVN